jgi:hypothetical protein
MAELRSLVITITKIIVYGFIAMVVIPSVVFIGGNFG